VGRSQEVKRSGGGTYILDVGCDECKGNNYGRLSVSVFGGGWILGLMIKRLCSLSQNE
jgi:hypothetical protein